MLDEAERSDLAASGVRIGVGLHTGTAFVGVLGTDDKLDFSALGDTVNVAARLGSIAGPGELVVSRWPGRPPGSRSRPRTGDRSRSPGAKVRSR